VSFVDVFGELPAPADTTEPFIGTATQTNRLLAHYKVEIGGVDITDALRPHLESLQIVDDGVPHATIEVDDRDAKLPIPPFDTEVHIELGWESEEMVTVFDGHTFDLEYGCARKQGGRKMWVHAFAPRMTSHAKTPMQEGVGEGAEAGQKEGKQIPMSDFLQKAASNAGFNANIAGFFDQFKSDRWEQQGESMMHLFERMAIKAGGMVHYDGGNSVSLIAPASQGNVMAIWGDNLISVRLRPYASRSTWAGGHQQHYDHQAANWIRSIKQFGMSFPWGGGGGGGGGGPEAMIQNVEEAASQGGADGDNSGNQGLASYEPGYGRIAINGEPSAKFGGSVEVVGVRPGVDGSYAIWVVEHHLQRGQGFITFLDVDVITTGGDVRPARRAQTSQERQKIRNVNRGLPNQSYSQQNQGG